MDLKIKTDRESLITELKYHCEVYKLGLRSIQKIVNQQETLSFSFNSKTESAKKQAQTFVRGFNTRNSYQNKLTLVSQKKTLDKISGIIRKTKTFLNGYSLLEKPIKLCTKQDLIIQNRSV